MFMLWGKCPVHLSLQTCEVRSWQIGDLASLVTHANNRKIWINLRDRFPYPYTHADGRAFIRASRRAEPRNELCHRRRRRGGRRHRLSPAVRRGTCVGRNRLLAGRSVLGARHRDRGALGGDALRHRTPRVDAHLRAAVRAQHGVVPGPGKGGIRARRDISGAAPSRTAPSSIRSNTRSSPCRLAAGKSQVSSLKSDQTSGFRFQVCACGSCPCR